ncbi:MAG: addiction module protein [Planctomycetota bacterium]
MNAQKLLAEAMKLPPDAREVLAVELLGSVKPSATDSEYIQQAWIEEIDRRVADYESGKTSGIPIEEAWPRISGRPWTDSTGSDG